MLLHSRLFPFILLAIVLRPAVAEDAKITGSVKKEADPMANKNATALADEKVSNIDNSKATHKISIPTVPEVAGTDQHNMKTPATSDALAAPVSSPLGGSLGTTLPSTSSLPPAGTEAQSHTAPLGNQPSTNLTSFGTKPSGWGTASGVASGKDTGTASATTSTGGSISGNAGLAQQPGLAGDSLNGASRTPAVNSDSWSSTPNLAGSHGTGFGNTKHPATNVDSFNATGADSLSKSSTFGTAGITKPVGTGSGVTAALGDHTPANTISDLTQPGLVGQTSNSSLVGLHPTKGSGHMTDTLAANTTKDITRAFSKLDNPAKLTDASKILGPVVVESLPTKVSKNLAKQTVVGADGKKTDLLSFSKQFASPVDSEPQTFKAPEVVNLKPETKLPSVSMAQFPVVGKQGSVEVHIYNNEQYLWQVGSDVYVAPRGWKYGQTITTTYTSWTTYSEYSTWPPVVAIKPPPVVVPTVVLQPQTRLPPSIPIDQYDVIQVVGTVSVRRVFNYYIWTDGAQSYVAPPDWQLGAPIVQNYQSWQVYTTHIDWPAPEAPHMCGALVGINVNDCTSAFLNILDPWSRNTITGPGPIKVAMSGSCKLTVSCYGGPIQVMTSRIWNGMTPGQTGGVSLLSQTCIAQGRAGWTVEAGGCLIAAEGGLQFL